MSPSSFNTKKLTLAAMIAAVYTVLTLVLAPISYGAVQVRLSEALTLLPVLFPEAIPGVAVGCLLANILGGSMLPDIVFGTLATLCAHLPPASETPHLAQNHPSTSPTQPSLTFPQAPTPHARCPYESPH